MIIVYSELKKLLPDLKVSGRQLGEDLTMIGHFCASCKNIENETVYDLEIKAANRADCLGYLGIARDLSALYAINLVYPFLPEDSLEILKKTEEIDIKVSAPKLVQTLRASKISNLKIAPSPEWLQKLLRLSDINPRNNLIDLTNYIMLLWGIPAHAFDAQKVNNNLNWRTSKKGESLTTFDGTTLQLQDGNLIISSDNIPASMSSIGGNSSGIDEKTTETIIEIAIYDPVAVHHDNRALSIQTEAGNRLEKFLSPTIVIPAFHHLQSLVTEICKGTISSHDFIFDNYEFKNIKINFDPNLPSQYAGVNISQDFSYEVLKKLDCQINLDKTVTPPTHRTDLKLEEDLIEEVIRMYGYNKINTNEPIDSTLKQDITPKVIRLSESLKNILVESGFDEVRSWPIIKLDQKLPEFCTEKYITLENSMNEEYITLRQSLVESLIQQVNERSRYKAPTNNIFELGKIFYEKNNKYLELHALGLYTDNPEILNVINNKLKAKLKFTNYHNYYQVILTDIDNFQVYETSTRDTSAVELTTQITELDATLYLDTEQDPQALYNTYLSKLDKKFLFSATIKDYYFDTKNNKHNYTFTCSYYNCDSSTAKEIHLRAFDLC